jgi:hypothetical protein
MHEIFVNVSMLKQSGDNWKGNEEIKDRLNLEDYLLPFSSE